MCGVEHICVYVFALQIALLYKYLNRAFNCNVILGKILLVPPNTHPVADFIES